jgi:hypothetical protein
MSGIKFLAKSVLSRAGALASPATTFNLRKAANQLEVGRWMREAGMEARRWVATREQLFDTVGAKIANERVLYLEFGVWQGAATRHWAKLLRNADSRLQGFDSFEGLPEAWNEAYPRGRFDEAGRLPSVDDPRVQFFKGWFDQTLPGHAFPEHDRLVANFDADLYSSTKCALDHVGPIIKVGSYLYFDELNDCDHELRALREFIEESGMKFALIGATPGYNHTMIERVA